MSADGVARDQRRNGKKYKDMDPATGLVQASFGPLSKQLGMLRATNVENV